MGFAANQIDGVLMAAVIHDIGKLSVPAEFLSMPRRLTDMEYSIIKTHAQAGHVILKNIEFPWPIARMVLEHHERMDGSGYPQGMTETDILIESRILAVADVLEAMASHRPYRPGLGLDVALREISENSGIFTIPRLWMSVCVCSTIRVTGSQLASTEGSGFSSCCADRYGAEHVADQPPLGNTIRR